MARHESTGSNLDVRRDVKRLRSIIGAAKLLNSTFELDKLLTIILDLATHNLNAARGTIYLIDEEKKELWSRVLKGKTMVEIRLPIGTGIAGHVAKSGRIVNVEDASKDKRFYGAIDQKSGFQTKTMLCAPMKNRHGKIIGVFQIINKKSGTFGDEDRMFLVGFSEHAALAIENAKFHQAQLEQERVEKEIQIAASIQQRLLPKTLPQLQEYEIAAATIPSRTVGGDWYAVVPLDDGRFVFTVADVSGKGIPAALLVSTLHASFRAYLENRLPLDALVKRLNLLLFDNTTPERFITFFVMALDTASHTVEFVNAGHNPPYLYRRPSGFVELAASGLPLGMMPDSEYKMETIAIEPDDVLVLYTDGVTEAMDRHEELYGEERLRQAVEQCAQARASNLHASILDDLRTFVGNEPQSDDITLLIARRTSGNPDTIKQKIGG